MKKIEKKNQIRNRKPRLFKRKTKSSSEEDVTDSYSEYTDGEDCDIRYGED